MANTPSDVNVIDDRADGLFQVRRTVFTDQEIWAREQRRIFDRCWLYVGHESEIPQVGDFRTRRVAGRPIIMARGNDGRVRALLNTCTHRGAMVCRHTAGNAKTFQCFYHAWTFDNQGKLVGVPGEDAYGLGFDRNQLALGQPRCDSYQGFVFITFNPEAEELPNYLADAKEYLDVVHDQGEPEGLEVVAGSQDYCMHANWKLLVENSYDGYHAAATHHRYFTQLMPDIGLDAPPLNGTVMKSYGFSRDLGNGHGVSEGPTWRVLDEFQRDNWERRYGRERVVRMLDHNHNVLIFPNLILINIWRTVRTFFPVAPDKVEISAWALMPKSDSREMRRTRLDNYLSFLGPGGFATPDDAEALECCQRGFASNREVQWSDISRGMKKEIPSGTDELQMRTFWRRWNALMNAEDSRTAATGRLAGTI